MKHLTTIVCALIAAAGAYLTATTAAGRSDDWTRYEAQVVGVLARADSAARANPATAILPKRAMTTRIARGLTGKNRD